MSKWNVTLTYTGEDEHVAQLSVSDSFSKDGDTINEVEIIALNLAHLLCAFEALGVAIPSYGEDVLQAFDEEVSLGWRFWRDMEIKKAKEE